MKAVRILALAAFTSLAGCGREAALQPAPGHRLPIKPLMARATPTVNELLTPPSYARPDRVDELVKKSQPRPADPFDLPPPSGGAPTSPPAGSDPGPASNTTSATPGR